MSWGLKRLGLANKICTARGSDNVSSNLAYLISSSSASLVLSLFLFLSTVFCWGCLSLTCFSLHLFVPHFGSQPVKTRALIPQTIGCVPVIKPYLFLFPEFWFRLWIWVFLSPQLCLFSFFSSSHTILLHQGKKTSTEILTPAVPETKMTPCGMWASLRALIQRPDAALERVLDNVVLDSA